MRLRVFLAGLLILWNVKPGFGQQLSVFTNLQAQMLETKTTSTLFKKLDSIKYIWKGGVEWQAYIKRSVDFGFEHQRIQLQFGNLHLLINLLTKDNNIYLNSFTEEQSSKFSSINRKLIPPRIDTSQVLSFLKQRNGFYKSAKKIKDLLADLTMEKVFAFYCGDGMLKTTEGKYVERLVKREKSDDLIVMMQSICCEQQAFGKAGFEMLTKAGYTKWPALAYQLEKRITAIKPALTICEGCIVSVTPLQL